MPRRRTLFALGAVLVVLLGCGACGAAATTTVTGGRGPTVYRFGVVGSKGKIAGLERNTPTVVTGITGTVVQIASSNSDGYALTSTGAVWAWGGGANGELGNGTRPTSVSDAVKVHIPTGVHIDSLANPMPFDGALAIDSNGNAWGWGLNADGDLCLSRLVSIQPVQIPLNHVTLATGARAHSLFAADGRVYGCGSGQYGELGNGSTSSSSTPDPVIGLPAGSTVTALASSWGGSGALLGNGAYYNWGYNAAGQLGDGSTVDSDVPVRVDLADGVHQVSQGGSGAANGQTVAVLANGSVWAWGNNMRGQLGNGSRADSDVPVAVKVPAGMTFKAVDSGGYASYGIDVSGRLWAWGGNENGQLGTGGGALVVTRPMDVGIHLTQVSSTASNVAGLGPR